MARFFSLKYTDRIDKQRKRVIIVQSTSLLKEVKTNRIESESPLICFAFFKQKISASISLHLFEKNNNKYSFIRYSTKYISFVLE